MQFLKSLRRRTNRRTSERRQAELATQAIEKLELRQLLVGQVSAVVRGSHLVLRGDDAANQVEIAFHEGNVAVRPKMGTRINGRRGPFVAFENTDTVPGSIIIDMNHGDDLVALSRGLKVTRDVRMYGRKGADTLGLDNVIVRRDLRFYGGDGNDAISIEDSRVVDDARLRLSHGDDVIRITTSEVRDNLRIRDPRGNDSIIVNDLDVRGHASMRLRTGDDVIDVQNARVDGNFAIRTSSGNDAVVVDDSTVAGQTRLMVGSGADSLILGNSDNDDTTPASGNVFKSTFFALGGRGNDNLRVDIDNDMRRKRVEIGWEGDNPGTGITDAALNAADEVRDDVASIIDVTRTLSANLNDNANLVSSGTGDNEVFVTNQDTVTITGRTDSDTDVEVDADGDGTFEDVVTTTDFNGDFSLEVPVLPGQQTVTVRNASDTDETRQFEIHRSEGTVVRMSTSLGDVDVELLSADAPIATANFLEYLPDYDNLIAQRVADLLTSSPDDELIVQAGRLTVDGSVLTEVTSRGNIQGEFNPENANVRGTLSMALSTGPDTGNSEWFFNLADFTHLDGIGHTVFGRVIGDVSTETPGSSMAVLDAIGQLPIHDLTSLDGFGLLPLTTVPLDGYSDEVTLTGTVSTLDNSDEITGAGTSFTTELEVGSRLTINGVNFEVASITNDTTLTVTTNASSDLSGLTAVTDNLTPPDETNYVVFSQIESILDAVT